jgi:hypothetical protein
MPNLKNSIIFLVIAVVIILGYIFFFKKDTAAVPNLTTTTPLQATPTLNPTNVSTVAGTEFLSLLLNVKNIKLNDAIFTDPAFNSLIDSSITLSPDGTEGRPNPFAPIGTDSSAVNPLNPPANASSNASTSTTPAGKTNPAAPSQPSSQPISTGKATSSSSTFSTSPDGKATTSTKN